MNRPFPVWFLNLRAGDVCRTVLAPRCNLSYIRTVAETMVRECIFGSSARMENQDTPDFELLGTLAQKAQGGDDASYEILLEQLDMYVHRVLWARLGPVAELDDLTQECLMGVHRSLSSYHPSRNIRPWIRAIVRYKIADYFRAQSRRREIPATEGLLDLASPTAGSIGCGGGLIEEVDIHALLKQLPAPLRRAVVLTKFHGLSCQEAARREEVSVIALRKRVSRAYKRMASLVEKELEQKNHGT